MNLIHRPAVSCFRSLTIRGTLIATLLLPAISGCQPSGGSTVTTGGDVPLSVDRLQNVTLTQVGSSGLTWKLSAQRLEISNELRPIHPDLAESLCGPGVSPQQITATWELIEAENTLKLTAVRADGRLLDDDVWLPITPAGSIRVNLASLQYNMQRSDQPLQIVDRLSDDAAAETPASEESAVQDAAAGDAPDPETEDSETERPAED